MNFFKKIFGISNNPVRGYEYLKKAEDLGRQGYYHEAINEYSKFIELNSDSSIAYYLRGITWTMIEDFNNAIEDFNKAIELNSSYSEAYLYRGKAKGNLGDFKLAIDDFDNAIKFDLNNAEAYYMRGCAKIDLGEIEDGNLDMEKSSKLGGFDY